MTVHASGRPQAVIRGFSLLPETYNSPMGDSELLKKALALPENERAELAGSLLDSLDPTIDEDAEVAWQEEISRRLKELDTGKVKTIPWEEVRERGRALLNRK